MFRLTKRVVLGLLLRRAGALDELAVVPARHLCRKQLMTPRPLDPAIQAITAGVLALEERTR